MYLELLPEIQEIVRKYLAHDELKVLSLINRDYCTALQPYVFQRVIKYRSRDIQLTESIIENMQHTKLLVLWDFSSANIFLKVNFKSLRTLFLNGCSEASEESFSVMCHALPQLKEFLLSPNGEMEDLSCFPNLEALTCLEKFSISHMDEPVDFVLRHLKAINSLKSIDVSFCYATPNDPFKYLAPLTLLQELSIHESTIEFGEGFSCLVKFSNLRRLELAHVHGNFSDRVYSVIGSLKSMEELILDDFKISDNGFAHICTLPKLKKLDISHCRISREDVFARIKALTLLEELILFDCRFSLLMSYKNCLQIISALPNLKTVDLRCTGVTEEEEQQVFGDKISSGKLTVVSGNAGDCYFYRNITGEA